MVFVKLKSPEFKLIREIRDMSITSMVHTRAFLAGSGRQCASAKGGGGMRPLPPAAPPFELDGMGAQVRK